MVATLAKMQRSDAVRSTDVDNPLATHDIASPEELEEVERRREVLLR